MADIQTGVLKPAYLAKAANAHASYKNNMAAARNLTGKARSVTGSPRSAEFHAQAQQHLGAAQSNVNTVRSMTAQPAGTLSGNFQVPGNPSNN